MAITAAEVDRLQVKGALPTACSCCGIGPGLEPSERAFIAQTLRDLTKLALGARRQMLRDALRNLSEGGLDALEEVGAGSKWLPE